jgi:fatty acid desaturase
MIWNSRVLLAAYAAVFAWAIATASWLPLMLLFFPRMYGAWLHELLAKAQDGALAIDVRDHRRNSRTIIMDPVLRFLYWNMNYHVEHHLFPTVPFHALPKAREAVADQMPPAVRGVWAAWKEMAPVFLRQQREPDFHIEPRLPEAAAF